MIQYSSLDAYFTIDFSTPIFLTWSRAVLAVEGQFFGTKRMWHRKRYKRHERKRRLCDTISGPWRFRWCLFSGGRLSTPLAAQWVHFASLKYSTEDSSVQLHGWAAMSHRKHTLQSGIPHLLKQNRR